MQYSSSNLDVVSVDKDGNLTTHKAGTAIITIKCGGKTKNVNVNVTNQVIDGINYDGVVSTGEYVGNAITKTNGKTTAVINGVVKNSNIHLSLVITHNNWSTESRIWWHNDNVEMYINETKYIIKFIDGVAVFPNSIAHAVTNTTTQNGKLITTIEMYIEGSSDKYRLKLGMNGKQFDWLGALWDDADQHNITTTGLVKPTIDVPITLKIDGIFDENIWTEINNTNIISATANGANVTVKGTIMNDGVLFGVIVNHTKAPEVSTNGTNLWYTFMNIEFHFNSGQTQFIYTCMKEQSNDLFVGGCTTITNGTNYTTTFEIYVPFTSIGLGNGTTSIDFTCSGWFETGWCWLFPSNQNWNSTHILTVDGIKKK